MKKLLLAIGLAATLMVIGTAAADETQTPMSFSIEVQMTGPDFVGLVPEGVRLDGHTVLVGGDGLMAGATGSATDYLLVRHDGVGVADVRGYGVLADGSPIGMTLKGFIGDPTIMPSIDVWLDPDYEWPDTDLPYHGAGWWQSMAPQHAFLNYTVFGFTGSINMATGVVRITFTSLAE